MVANRNETNQPAPANSRAAEPTASNHPIPIWLKVVVLVLLCWGIRYVYQFRGSFDPHVYLPYRSLAEVIQMQPPRDAEWDFFSEGERLFHGNCAICHMANGAGNPANGCPPLAGSEWVAAPGAGRLVRIISKGLTGPIQVRDKVYDTGTMLAIGDQMPGDEHQKARNIAAIITFIRKNFGGGAGPVRPEQVAAIRAQIAGHSASFTPDELKSVPADQ
jgi:mono/diheme cytochrome c family protein